MRTTSRVERVRLLLMAERYKVELGKAIAARRESLGMTQKDLALATHYKEAQTVSRWERGQNAPSDLDVVAAALQWTLAEMVAGINPPNTRVARQFGMVVEERPTETPDLSSNTMERKQLDRIEAKLDRLLADAGLSEPDEGLGPAGPLPDLPLGPTEPDASTSPEAEDEPPSEEEAAGPADG